MEKKELTYEAAKETALRILEYRQNSEKELRDKLRFRGAYEKDIDRIIEFCKEYKLIDDREYAKRKARDLANLKKMGKRRIYSELRAKGIDGQWIQEALEELEDVEEEEVLLPLVRKRLKGDFEKKNVDRVLRYFTYRGYSFSDIKRCVERIKEEDGI